MKLILLQLNLNLSDLFNVFILKLSL